MGSIYQYGTLNTTALIVPDVDVVIVPPQVTLLNGVPTNIEGVVGSASWGAVNTPVTVGDMVGYSANFGPVMARKYDLGTAVAVGVQQGASNFACVRATDGTDTAATGSIMDGAATPVLGAGVAAYYTGSLGASISWVLGAGSAAGTRRLTLALPQIGTIEIFDNITGTGAAFWANLVAAVNTGIAGVRSKSQLVLLTQGTSTAAPAAVGAAGATGFLTGGSDGASGVTAQTLLGQDAIPRKGMFALRGSGASVGVLADADDSTTWATQVAYGLSEGTYMMLVGPAGDTIANAIATKQSAGIDTYTAKLLFGDWIYWNDLANGVIRLVSPQGFVAGRLANLAPQNSSLNKQIYGIVGTQRSAGNLARYSNAELQQLIQAGIDLIANPAPGGGYFTVRAGHNTSSNAVIQGDNYTRMTNYIAATLAAGMGIYVGQLQSPDVQQAAKATIESFLENMADQKPPQIGNSLGTTPYSVILGASNNPQSRVALGYMQADVSVTYLSVIEKFLINVQGGQSVTVANTSTQVAA